MTEPNNTARTNITAGISPNRITPHARISLQEYDRTEYHRTHEYDRKEITPHARISLQEYHRTEYHRTHEYDRIE